MILTGNKIQQCVKEKTIVLDPFSAQQINPNSYDLKLGSEVLSYTDKILDPTKDNKTISQKIPSSGLVLKQGQFVLGHSQEIIGSDHFVPIIRAKSSIARLGIFVHVTADLIDIGSIGQITFQLFASKSIRLYSGMLIGQVTFWCPKGEITLYSGKYQNSRGPQKSASYMDVKI